MALSPLPDLLRSPAHCRAGPLPHGLHRGHPGTLVRALAFSLALGLVISDARRVARSRARSRARCVPRPRPRSRPRSRPRPVPIGLPRGVPRGVRDGKPNSRSNSPPRCRPRSPERRTQNTGRRRSEVRLQKTERKGRDAEQNRNRPGAIGNRRSTMRRAGPPAQRVPPAPGRALLLAVDEPAAARYACPPEVDAQELRC